MKSNIRRMRKLAAAGQVTTAVLAKLPAYVLQGEIVPRAAQRNRDSRLDRGGFAGPRTGLDELPRVVPILGLDPGCQTRGNSTAPAGWGHRTTAAEPAARTKVSASTNFDPWSGEFIQFRSILLVLIIIIITSFNREDEK